MQECKLPIELHSTIKDHTFFNGVKEISITRPELFKHGIMFSETPEHIKDTDFDHLQSKVPAIDQLFGEYLELTHDKIINKSNDDIFKKLVSQIIGVGAGLIYFNKLLNINPNRITKVPPPKKKQKYMDYQVSLDGKNIEFEAKGTVAESSIESKVKDILAKKNNSTASFKLGTVVVARKPYDKTPSRLVVCDDPPPDTFVDKNPSIGEVIFHYLDYLSFVMDNVQYNKFYKQRFSHPL